MFSVSLFSVWQERVKAKDEVSQIEKKINASKELRGQYEASLNDIKTEQGIDRAAREKFNLQKPGEEVSMFVGKTNTSTDEKNVKTNFVESIINFIKSLWH